MQFLDLGFTYTALRDELDQAIANVLSSGWYLGGTQTQAFEAAFADFCRADHAIGLSNGLDALYAILHALEIGEGDEVIVPAHTFIATWLAVERTGATLVPVDADPQTMNWDLTAVANAITPRTKAVMPVHLYGQLVDMKALNTLLDGTGIPIIEDAAQAHGAQCDGYTAGSGGTAAGFSFYPGKNLGAFGDGGAITTSDPDLLQKLRAFCNYGAVAKYDHQVAGINARLDEVQAAILGVKLQALEVWTERRRDIAKAYLAELADLPNLRLPGVGTDPLSHVWHLFVVRVPDRDAMMTHLTEADIPTLIHYPIANHHSGAFADPFKGQSFPITEEICSTCLSLPIGPHLTDDDIDRVIWAVRQAARAT